MTKEELLEEANRRYPLSTKYRNTGHSVEPGATKTVQAVLRIYETKTKNWQITDGHGGSVYFEGQWAEIIDLAPTYEIF